MESRETGGLPLELTLDLLDLEKQLNLRITRYSDNRFKLHDSYSKLSFEKPIYISIDIFTLITTESMAPIYIE